MLCLYNDSTNPYFNLATEEYLLKNSQEEIFMLWRNEPSIIIGRFQNTMAEINLDYVQEKQIKVVRRLTGGGAVFHDLGNLNYTFIANNTQGDFRTYTAPILEVLHKMGVPAQFTGRNDLTINGQKISGNAECIHDNRLLHHGTLLFSSAMTDLSKALKVNPLKFQDKAVKSVRKRVTNIAEHLSKEMDVTRFAELIMQHIRDSHPENRVATLTAADISQICRLKEQKYETWEWNFGNAPKYTFTQSARTRGGILSLTMDIQNGCIRDLKLHGDFFAKKEIQLLEQQFIGKPHRYERIAEILRNIVLDEYLLNVTSEELLALFF